MIKDATIILNDEDHSRAFERSMMRAGARSAVAVEGHTVVKGNYL